MKKIAYLSIVLMYLMCLIGCTIQNNRLSFEVGQHVEYRDYNTDNIKDKTI